MASSTSGVSASAIQEGLICAECHKEFTSIETLLRHYETLHSGSSAQGESNTKSIKNLIEKAKLKLASKGDGESLAKGPPAYYDVWDEVSLGKWQSHTQTFKRIRLAQVERTSSESSKLLIRLHKLILNGSQSGDEGKRRNYEQEVVPWIDPKHVSRCPDCTQTFNLLLRKHHCRLCGSILCESCSNFISAELGSSLTASLGPGQPQSQSPTKPKNPASTPSPNSSDYKIRSCQYCYHLVTNRNLNPDSKPIITQFYDKLQSLEAKCEKLRSEFQLMTSSIERGENLYSIEQCMSLRSEALQLTEKIDILSKKIILLGTESGSGEIISSSEAKLRSRIRIATINWIREFISGLSVVPGSGDNNGVGGLEFGEGWTPSLSSVVNETDDPFSIQVSNLKKWIAEAKKAKKQEEVDLLEANLKELLELSSTN